MSSDVATENSLNFIARAPRRLDPGEHDRLIGIAERFNESAAEENRLEFDRPEELPLGVRVAGSIALPDFSEHWGQVVDHWLDALAQMRLSAPELEWEVQLGRVPYRWSGSRWHWN